MRDAARDVEQPIWITNVRANQSRTVGCPVAGLNPRALRRLAYTFAGKAAGAVVHQDLRFREALFLRRLLTTKLFRLRPGSRDHIDPNRAPFRLISIEQVRRTAL